MGKISARLCLLYSETSQTKLVGVGGGESTIILLALDPEVVEVVSRKMSLKLLTLKSTTTYSALSAPDAIQKAHNVEINKMVTLEKQSPVDKAKV